MTEKLPTKLKKEPLIDALFEMRFASALPASNIIPGVLFSQLPGSKTIEQLPAGQLPKPILDSDPNLRFAPLVRINWDKFLISVGDRSLAVSCKMPYPGWETFKPAILQVVGFLREIGIIQEIHRFSMKYIDLIPAKSLADQVLAINGTVVLGNHTLTKEIFSLRMEIPSEDMLHAIQIASSAVVTLQDGSSREGVIVDIDTISDLENQDFAYWLEQLSDKLESMHLANKTRFFECIRPETIASLEPVYE